MSTQNKSYISNDRFGNPYQVIGCKPNKGGYPVGYVELGGKLYKLEPSPSNKDGVQEWIKITQVKKNAKPTSM
jgi:hypothetical protein